MVRSLFFVILRSRRQFAHEPVHAAHRQHTQAVGPGDLDHGAGADEVPVVAVRNLLHDVERVVDQVDDGALLQLAVGGLGGEIVGKGYEDK